MPSSQASATSASSSSPTRRSPSTWPSKRATPSAGCGECAGSCGRRERRREPTFPRREPMDFELTDRCNDFRERLLAFMDERVYPAERMYEEQLHEAGDPHAQPPVMEELKDEARRRGLWNMFHPDPAYGPGLSNAEYAPLAE